MAPFTQLRPRIAQGVGHGVEQSSKPAELVGATRRNRLIQIPGGKSLRAAFEVAQRQIDKIMYDKADQHRRNDDKSQGKAGDREGAVAQLVIERVERIDDVENAKDRSLFRVLMAGGLVARRLITDDFHAAEQRPAIRAFKRPGSLALGDLFERLLALMTMRTQLGVTVDGQANFRRVSRMGDCAFAAQNSDPIDVFLFSHIMDDPVDISG